MQHKRGGPMSCCPISCHVVSSRVVQCRVVSSRVVSCRVVSRGVVFRVSLFRVVSCHVVFHFVFSVPCHHSPCFLCRVVFPATLVSSFPVFLHHDILDVTHYYEILLPMSCFSSLYEVKMNLLPKTEHTSPHGCCCLVLGCWGVVLT